MIKFSKCADCLFFKIKPPFQLIGRCAVTGEGGLGLQAACEKFEPREKEELWPPQYRTKW